MCNGKGNGMMHPRLRNTNIGIVAEQLQKRERTSRFGKFGTFLAPSSYFIMDASWAVWA